MKNRLGLVAAVLVVSACSGGGSGEDEVVAWVDQVCGAAVAAFEPMTSQPKVDVSDPVKLKEGVSGWLGEATAAMDKAAADLEDLEDGPHPDSAKFVASISETVVRYKAPLTEAKKTIDAADVNDQDAVARAFSQVAGQMREFVGSSDVESGFDEASFVEAQKKAKNCEGFLKQTPTS